MFFTRRWKTVHFGAIWQQRCAFRPLVIGLFVLIALLNTYLVTKRFPKDCLGTMTSKGYNLSSDETCNFNGTGDLNNTDPKLGQLGNYGGPTQTIPLLCGSPAIDAGNPNGCTDGNGHLLKTDEVGRSGHWTVLPDTK
jgi:hypothetical protein